jgi:hypothetical protein
MKRLIVLALLICPLSVSAGKHETLSLSHPAGALRARITAQPRPESSQISNFPLLCVTETKADLHSLKFHAFACAGITISGDGIVLGGFLNGRGRLMCELTGYTGGCLTLTGCGADGTVC